MEAVEISDQLLLSVDDCQLYESVPVPSGSALSSIIDNVSNIFGIPSIENSASPSSTFATETMRG